MRPSARSTDKVSSLTSTWVARASRVSTVEELIPTLQQLFLILLDQLADPIDLFTSETAAALEPDGVEPEFRFAVITFDVDVRRLAPIAGVEEEPKRTHSEYSRHGLMLHRPGR